MRFNHSCSDCIPLGEFANHDLYACCTGTDINTLIARASSSPGDYKSGLDFAMHYGSEPIMDGETGDLLFEALRRATSRGLKPKSIYL